MNGEKERKEGGKETRKELNRVTMSMGASLSINNIFI